MEHTRFLSFLDFSSISRNGILTLSLENNYDFSRSLRALYDDKVLFDIRLGSLGFDNINVYFMGSCILNYSVISGVLIFLNIPLAVEFFQYADRYISDLPPIY